MSYDQILQVDTSLAENVLKTLDPDTGCVMPPNLVPEKFVHFSADNIDILDETMDGKNTFHATQISAWQRGDEESNKMLGNLKPSTNHTLSVPESMERVYPVEVKRGPPVFSRAVEKEWYDASKDNNDSVGTAQATDLGFNLLRSKTEIKGGWTEFNQSLSQNEHEVTAIGYMPILQAPAHEFDTLNTVVKRCMHISAALGQQYTVITVDQALYCKLVELKWAIPEYQNKLVIQLGGLHTSMCFLNAIGDHMKGSGLVETWVEGGLFGPNATEHVMNGKAYKRAMRAHKITLQSLWQLLMPFLLEFCQKAYPDLFQEISELASSSENAGALIASLKSARVQKMLDEFVAQKSEENVNFKFWWSYMEMLSILLMFTRAQREGNWDLYLHSFRCMLPYFFRYDHQNYAKWGSVYIAEMEQLPQEVLEEFKKGNFVVKWKASKFNQVSPDQSLEWLNGIGKRGGGIVGITKTSSALSRWALSYNLRSQIADSTHKMFGLEQEDKFSHNESTPGRRDRDKKDESSLTAILKQFKVFSPPDHPTCLYNIATNDLVTDEIQVSLLNAKKLGEQRMNEFVEERLATQQQEKVKFWDTMHKNFPPTFDTLYQVVKSSKEKDKTKILRADRNVLQRLIVAYEAGRTVDLYSVLSHELMPVPVALAEMNGNLRSGQKSVLADILTSGTNCPSEIQLQGSSCLLIDGLALVAAIGRPSGAQTFGDFADSFQAAVHQASSRYQQVHVIFDRYQEDSIKSGTRKRRTKSARPIRRVIEDRSVPLPHSWSNFLALPENKSDLARFLSEHIIVNAPQGKVVVAAGGFEDERDVRSSEMAIDLSPLKAAHEEADTRLILHCVHTNCDNIVVSARDTDVLLLLVAHSSEIPCTNLFMMSGTAAKRKYFNIRAISENLPAASVSALLPFHALTGCDTTSFICNHSKKSAWKVFRQYHELLSSIGEGELTDEKMKKVEKFVCKLYKLDQIVSVDEARVALFSKKAKPEALPPTEDALSLHKKRVHYQTLVWKQAHSSEPHLPDPVTLGWKRSADNKLEPLLMTKDPIPKACQEIISCSCSTGCTNLRCSCKKAKLFCTSVCACKSNNVNPIVCRNTDTK